MIYTCYEMITDCRAGRADGWTYFIRNYVPVVRRLLAHYFPERADVESAVERVLVGLHEPRAGLFQMIDPAPERAFVAELRQHAIAAEGNHQAGAAPDVSIGLEELTTALDSLTLTERLVVWFETMRYDSTDTSRMLRMSAPTVDAIRVRAGELVRGSMDSWRSSLLTDNGAELGRQAAEQHGKDCPPAKVFFDVIDGRATWLGREEMERHVRNCWYCVDHYCRLLEVVDVLRAAQPLGEAEILKYQLRLGIQPAKRSFWRR